MSARRRPNMRRLVDTTVQLVCSGEVSHEVAAVQLLASGVPVAVIGRVLATVPVVDAVRSSPADRKAGAALRTEMALFT